MLVIADASPLHYLILIASTDTLPALFSRIVIPRAVAAELQHPQTPVVVRSWMAAPPPWLDIQDVGTTPEASLAHLDPGEQEAITLQNDRMPKNTITDDRKHLTIAVVEKLLAAVKGNWNEARDRCLLLLMFRHGLRACEACGLVLSQVDMDSRVLYVARLKKGLPTTHPLRADELGVIKAWLPERAKMKPETDAFFVSERRGPLSLKTAGLAIRTYGERAGLSPPTRTCCAMRAASLCPTTARTRG